MQSPALQQLGPADCLASSMNKVSAGRGRGRDLPAQVRADDAEAAETTRAADHLAPDHAVPQQAATSTSAAAAAPPSAPGALPKGASCSL